VSMKLTPRSTGAVQYTNGVLGVGWVAPHSGAGQVHRAIAKAVDGQVAPMVRHMVLVECCCMTWLHPGRNQNIYTGT